MLCLLAGTTIAPLMAGAITLAWTHSVEKILWEEDWRLEPAGLELVEARVRGRGAGMEPPPEARFVDGGLVAGGPRLPPLQEVVMRRSGATADWRICTRRAMPADGRLRARRSGSRGPEGLRWPILAAQSARASAGLSSLIGSMLVAWRQSANRM